jgi:hypothetical protein
MGIAATQYPLLDAFFTVLWIVGFFLWIWLAILVFSDIFRSRDMSGWAKAGWIVLVFILPLIGVLLYLIVRGKRMQQHAEEEAVASDLATREYIRSVVSQKDDSDELAKLTSLHASGVLSDEEFASMKARLAESTSK